MSYNNVLPWWVYSVQYEHFLASCSCAFDEEWYAGTSKEIPDYIINKLQATFSKESK